MRKKRKIRSRFSEYVKKRVTEEKLYRNKPDRNWRRKWIPLVKYDHDWDGGYLVLIMSHKLHMMLDFFSERGNCIMAESERLPIVEQLEKACLLADEVVEDDFYKEAYEYLEAHLKRNEVKTKFGIGYEGVWDSSESEKEYKRLSDEADSKRSATIKEFFDFVRDHYQNWWD